MSLNNLQTTKTGGLQKLLVSPLLDRTIEANCKRVSFWHHFLLLVYNPLCAINSYTPYPHSCVSIIILENKALDIVVSWGRPKWSFEINVDKKLLNKERPPLPTPFIIIAYLPYFHLIRRWTNSVVSLVPTSNHELTKESVSQLTRSVLI